MKRVFRVCAAFALLVLIAGVAIAADKKVRRGEQVWTAPDFASFGVASIGMLPAASYDHDLVAQKQVEGLWAQMFAKSGYRWVSPTASREMLRRDGGDSLIKAVDALLVTNGRVDSLAAPALSRSLRTRALLSVRIERWEQLQMEFNQAGKPTTTVQLTAALVDSTGRLLWKATGSETGEGPYQDPSTNALGVKSSGLAQTPITGQGGAPSFPEVLTKLLTRWTGEFPAKAAPPAPAK